MAVYHCSNSLVFIVWLSNMIMLLSYKHAIICYKLIYYDDSLLVDDILYKYIHNSNITCSFISYFEEFCCVLCPYGI